MFPKPIAEPQRIEALKSYSVLDTPNDPTFDRVARNAARLFNVPIAVVSLVDQERQWFKACVGLDASETPRDVAFCAHAIMRDSVMVVPDATADPRFANNPLVLGPPNIRFYAGAPLVTPEGFRLGTLCIIDTKPREMLSEQDQASLADLASIVVEALEYRRIRAEEQNSETRQWLKIARDAADRANASKSEFLAMISHELRTPLNGIIGFSDLLALQRFGPLGHQSYVDYAKAIRQSGEHLLTLVQTILEFARAQGGHLALEETRFEVDDLIEHCIKLLSARANDVQIAVSHTRAEGSLALFADKGQTLQMLLSLVDNAIKFNRRNGRVEISAKRNRSGGIQIDIVDTGIGIPQERIDQLTAPFVQIDASLARQHEGLGLGLAVTRKLIEVHGGRLLVESQQGEWTCASLVFPPCRAQQESAPKIESLAHAASSP